MSTGRIKIRVGPIEVEYEGTEEFMREELPELLAGVANLHKAAELPALSVDAPAGVSAEPAKRPASLDMTTNTIAARLGASSGQDLLVAAAAHLTLVKGGDTFTRAELSAEMKGATGYFKESYAKNLTSYIQGAIKADKIMGRSNGSYALSGSLSESLRSRLGG